MPDLSEGPICTICGKQATQQDIDDGWWPPCEHAAKVGLHTLVYRAAAATPKEKT